MGSILKWHAAHPIHRELDILVFRRVILMVTTQKRTDLLFLPTTIEEMNALGWQKLDVILVSGDSYIDSPYSGVAVIGKVLQKAGFRVGIIAQPDVNSSVDISRLGEPALFWGVTGGTVDSMVANYTATLRKRRSDDFTPGGVNNRRPDRAVLVYTNLIKRTFKNTKPIVLGGIEASLRRITHYDYWTNKLRASILFDSKADYLLYGMADLSIVELARAFKEKKSPLEIRGLCTLAKTPPENYLILPSFEDVTSDKEAFIRMYHLFYQNNDPHTAKGLAQQKGDRWLVQNPPANILTRAQMDKVYSLGYEHDQHPYYEKQGSVKALETIRFSIPTHRGCYGECSFCAIAVHEGRTVSSRSEQSILAEVEEMTRHPKFKGIITDLSGPTANMYGFECVKKLNKGVCQDKRCVFPEICPILKIDHSYQIELLKKIRQIPGVKKVFVGSGIRYDMVLADKQNGLPYLKEIVAHHTSGQLKVAPEHADPYVLKMMGKPPVRSLLEFKQQFETLTRQVGKDQYLTYYLIAAYPGSSDNEMKRLKEFVSTKLNLTPEQVQVFTPTPSTYASVMYYTEKDPFTGEAIFVEKNIQRKIIQKEIITEPITTKTRPVSQSNKRKMANDYAKYKRPEKRTP
ncbi:MAG: putative Fe-S oxidoreductase family protein [Chloroflexi bacterium]|nr:MAG: putative Fe-S oxidoreductase family protein [Chloroflexota bacterium]